MEHNWHTNTESGPKDKGVPCNTAGLTRKKETKVNVTSSLLPTCHFCRQLCGGFMYKLTDQTTCRTVRFWLFPSEVTSFHTGPHGLTVTWWGCCSSCLWQKPTKLAHPFLFCFCVCFCLCGPFNCISFHKFSWQLSAFSLCSSGLNSALLVLSTTLSLHESLPLP